VQYVKNIVQASPKSIRYYAVGLASRLIKIPRTIDIPVLLRTLDATGKIFKIGFSGGEPFLVPNIIDACVALMEKHYIELNTNLTSLKIKEFAERIKAK
jgi:organic radical activating enzyme